MNFTVTTRMWVLSTEWTRTWPSTGSDRNEKMVAVTLSLNGRSCSPGCVRIVSY